MTISYIEPVITYVSSGNGTYPFAFKVLAESDIEVWYTSASTGARVKLVRGSDFSVTVSNPGSTVTILDNAPAGGQILIERRVPIDQPTDWVNNGPFDMDLLEADLDRIIMIVQQLGWDISSGRAAINFRGPWVTLAEYTVRDIVRDSAGNYYFCIVSHTSGTFSTDLAAGNWVLLLDFAAVETHATNAAASATSALASRNTAIARSAAAELSEIAAAQSASNAAASAANILDWPVSAGLATDVAALLAIGRKNMLINGGFDVWQRGTSFSSDPIDAFAADRWLYNPITNATTTLTRQPLAAGKAGALFTSRYYMRVAILTSNNRLQTVKQRIENLMRFSGRTVTLSWYAKSYVPAVNNMGATLSMLYDATELSPTPHYVYHTASSSMAVTTSWRRYTRTFEIPDATHETLTAHSCLEVRIDLTAQNANTTYDIADVQLEFGDTATAFEYRHPAEELALCQWYYEKATIDTIAIMLTTTQAQLGHMSYAPKRIPPTITWPPASVNTLTGTPGTIVEASVRTHGFAPTINWTGGTASAVGRMRYVGVEFNSELNQTFI